MSEYTNTQTADNAEVSHKLARVKFPDQAYYLEDGTIGFRPSREPEGYLLGNPDFPVASYRELIIDTVNDNMITIIVAGTGTGKSTNIMQYFLEHGGFDYAISTQPRVMAARSLHGYVEPCVQDSLSGDTRDYVGYATAVESDTSEENEIIYVTDGLLLAQLIHAIDRGEVPRGTLVVIDEFHERGSNMDAVAALCVKHGIRLVIMSATIDASNLSEFYSEVLGKTVPVIDIPGVTHEVIEREGGFFDEETIAEAKKGNEILGFVPGRKEISSNHSKVAKPLPASYTILPLDGDQTPQAQQRVFGHYPDGKTILSTPVGQTSITIDGIDTVVDSGYERTSIIDDNDIVTLAIQPSSRATSDQRRGRVGRTKPGTYILAQLKGYPPLPSAEERPAYDTPEILRKRLDDLQLKLGIIGHTISDLPFYNQPDQARLERGNERLIRLGLLRKMGSAAFDAYVVTGIGREVAQLPLDVNLARMVIEAREYGPSVELQMIAAAAVAQIKGITSTAKGSDRWRRLTSETTSDVIAGVDFLIEGMARTRDQLPDADIITLRFDKAMRSFMNMAERRGLNYEAITKPDADQREMLRRSIVAGTDELFVLQGKKYSDRFKGKRRLVTSTTIADGAELMVGSAFNLQQMRNKKIATHTLITGATAVSLETLMEIVPHRIETKVARLYIDPQGSPRTEHVVSFDGRSTNRKITREAVPGPELQRFMVDHLFTNKSLGDEVGPNTQELRRTLNSFRKLQHQTTEDLGIEYSMNQIKEVMLKESHYSATRFRELDPFIDLEKVRDIIPEDIRQEIEAGAPDTIHLTDSTSGVDMVVDVAYSDNKAQITIPERYYHLLPFVIGNNHRVEVRPRVRMPFMGLEKARDIYDKPSRVERRNSAAEAESRTHVGLHTYPDQDGKNGKVGNSHTQSSRGRSRSLRSR